MVFQEAVKHFQLTGGEEFPNNKTKLHGDLYDKRNSLFREEWKETVDAFNEFNKAKAVAGFSKKWRTEILDGLCDMKYINDGSANLAGVILADDAQEKVWGTRTYSIHKELHNLDGIDINDFERINAKIYKLAHAFGFSLANFQEALSRVHASNMSKFCRTEEEALVTCDAYIEKGVKTHIKKVDDFYVVRRSKDNKILKSIKYTPVELSDLIY